MKSGQLKLVIVNDEYVPEVQGNVRETLAVSGNNLYIQQANESGSKVYYEVIENEKQNKGYMVMYPDNPNYIAQKKKLKDAGYNVDKMTMPIYLEEKYDPSEAEIDFSDYNENEKVEVGTYTYKKLKTAYKSETLTDTHGDKTIYCYNNSGKLCLMVEVDSEDGTETIAIVKELTYSVNPSLFNLNSNAVNVNDLEEKGIITQN